MLMLILGIEPSLIAYKTIVRTDTLYELKNNTQPGTRTQNLKIRSLTLYPIEPARHSCSGKRF